MSIANVVSGLFGGTPCTGVLIRTNVNIQTKATHKTSQFINAVFVLFVVLLFSPVFVYLPMSVIASILITSSCRLVPKTVMKQLWDCDRFDFWVLIITWLLCVFLDGATGLLIGAFVSFLKLGKLTSDAQMHINNFESEYGGQKKQMMEVDFEGSLNYINVFHFENQVIDGMNNADPEYVCINISNALFVDMDGLIALEKIFSKKAGNIAIIVAQQVEDSVLTKSWWFKKVKE
jgi:SulP family sulfate permease